ncbi:hypothetical protein CRG98_005061 [Punica granatum]|uniref:Uncharacterized protein n=1 Tax=Punica granatum TaxID=22663 RepID=A0A2I0L1D5_PUNGR|nr:hypothetical protein CRG98_005061 [Punica granatum]
MRLECTGGARRARGAGRRTGVQACAGRGQAHGRAGVRGARAGARACAGRGRALARGRAGERARACAGVRAGVRGRARGWRWRVTIHSRVAISPEMHYLT